MKPWIRAARGGVLACAAWLLQPGEVAAQPPQAASPVEGSAAVPPGRGVVAGALVMDFKDSSPELRNSLIANSTMSVLIRRRNDPDAKEVTFSSHDKHPPGMTRSTSSDQRVLFVRALPPGEYEITHLGTGTLTSLAWQTIPGGSMRFTVASDSITYIGDWVVRAIGGKDFIGVTHFSAASTALEDDVDEDSVQLYHARPDLRALPIHDVVHGTVLPAPGLNAEAEGLPVSDTLPFRDVAALKAAGNIGPAVFAKLEAFHPSAEPPGRGALRRLVLHRAVTRDGKAIGGNIRVLELLPEAPGYVYDVMPTKSGPLRMLQYMSLIPVRARATTHGQRLTGLHLDTESSSSQRLNDVRLPAFDGALAPGASWSYDYETDTSVQTKTVMSKQNRSNFSIIKRECRTTERQPASTLSPKLAGTMLTVSCVALDRSRNELLMAYIENYGVFVPLRQTMTLPPNGAQIVSEFSVLRVEMSGEPATAAAAASAAEEVPDAE